MSLEATSTALPFVSVVIPVYNNRTGLVRTLEGLQQQTYPAPKREILVVDNGSTEDIRDITTKYSCVFLQENQIHNSYAARNAGVRHATGDIIAFIDADCIPVRDWLAEGVQTMQNAAADIVGGNVHFTFSSVVPRIAEITDSIVFLQQEKYVKYRKTACTANVFVRKVVFDAMGLFSVKAASSTDIYFMSRAVQAGHPIAFSSGAIVRHRARSFAQLMQKSWRIGTGKGVLLRGGMAAGAVSSPLLYLRELNPIQRMRTPFLLSKLNPRTLLQALRQSDRRVSSTTFVGILLWCYSMVVVGTVGVLRGFLFGKSTR